MFPDWGSNLQLFGPEETMPQPSEPPGQHKVIVFEWSKRDRHLCLEWHNTFTAVILRTTRKAQPAVRATGANLHVKPRGGLVVTKADWINESRHRNIMYQALENLLEILSYLFCVLFLIHCFRYGTFQRESGAVCIAGESRLNSSSLLVQPSLLLMEKWLIAISSLSLTWVDKQKQFE